MRNGGDVSDVAHFQPTRIQRTNRGLASRARSFDLHVEVLQTVQLDSSFACTLGSHLGRKRSAFARATETWTTRCGPAQSIALAISDGDNGVVEGRMNECDSVYNRLARPFLRSCLSCWLCHR